MSFTNPTNLGRVNKILDTLDLIEKSAESNGASEEQIVAMLQPLLDRIGTPPSPAPSQVATQPATTSHWNSAVEMARNAPLADVSAAMMIFLTRIEQEVFEMQT